MKKRELIEKTDLRIEETKNALQLIWDNINRGQQKQLIKIPEIKELLDRYKVNYEGAE